MFSYDIITVTDYTTVYFQRYKEWIVLEEKFNLVDISLALLKKWWIILISMFMIAVIFYGHTKFFVAPVYRTNASLYVSNTKGSGSLFQDSSEVSLNNLLTSQEMLKTCIEILSTDRFYTRVKNVSGLNFSAGYLKGMVKMEQKNETNVLEVSVTAPDPHTAYILIETFLACATDEVEWIVSGGSIKTIDHATYSTNPTSKGATKKGIIGAIIGFIISAAIILLIEFTDSRIKSSSDLTQYGLYILAEVPSVLEEEETVA